MNLHLTSQSEKYSVEESDEGIILKWAIHLDLHDFKYVALTDFRAKPGHLIDNKHFSLIASNLVKSDTMNPQALMLFTTSYNHAIANKGLIRITLINLIKYSDWFPLDRSSVDEISFLVTNSSINSKSQVKISLALRTDEISD